MTLSKSPPTPPPPPTLTLTTLPPLIWHFTESNFPTPNPRPHPHPHPPPPPRPPTILFNWATVLIFDLSNQRLPESIQEDHLNKPWRPLPSNRITATQTRRLLLGAIPAVLALNYHLGVWQETALIMLITWLYNDLRAGDEIIRDAVIAVAYGLFNVASLRIACFDGSGGRGSGSRGSTTLPSMTMTTMEDIHPTPTGYIWSALISGVILTTMQIQDLKDQAGDRSRGRRTLPIVLGERCSRALVAGFVGVWSVACVWFWSGGWHREISGWL
ncbi:hypothetical protein BO70DRAFT_424246 [Aspergillus heteromorphus CBS 117.55]|uniref:UbiA prenyltransferase n=1 Tax=Aspergillus heteromorphus CBS 117.55 TaxID=1448321 RepID=A0A317WEW1_9EURO|nr:uncharacterized protein BO70DRAFT_424246 [Aspergillus heteromorphus CBS 117.55]PWY84974.1 hypothetical protein BO70DRAFT_424246 [Aspergillus heteromorphus CBS 117.55]